MGHLCKLRHRKKVFENFDDFYKNRFYDFSQKDNENSRLGSSKELRWWEMFENSLETSEFRIKFLLFKIPIA